MRRTALMAMSLIAIGLAIPSSARADYFYYAGTGHYYGLTTGTGTWNQEEAAAVALGGYLASITSQGEEDFLINTFVTPTTPGGELQPFWIGLRDVNFSPNNGNRDFQWTTGEPLTYTDWNSSTSEPNNNGGNEWYVAFNFHYAFGQGPKGTWNDTYQGAGPFGTRLYYGIVELESVPEPASLVMLGTGGLGLLGHGWRRKRAGGPV